MHISVASVLIIGGSGPILVFLLNYLIVREKITKKEIVGSFATLIGVAIVIDPTIFMNIVNFIF